MPQYSPWDLSLVTPPWGERPSIYQHVLAHISPDLGLLEAGAELPDEQIVFPAGKLRWVAGAMDNICNRAESADASAEEIYAALEGLAGEATDAQAEVLYAVIARQSVISYVDPLLRLIDERYVLPKDRMSDIARWLATEAADREAVKLGVALLGHVAEMANMHLLFTLGRHEEFTLYAAVALCRASASPEHALWELARHVRGWGRINIVERLANTQDDEIKAWMLREGYRNDIMIEYTALPCAVGGGLRKALEMPASDEELLTGAGEILSALIAGGPGPGMRAYDDGLAATELYLTHLLARGSELSDFLVVNQIDRFLADLDEEERWDTSRWLERRHELRAIAQAYLSRDDWMPLIHVGLADPDRFRFLGAASVARAKGVDTWEHFYSRMLSDGYDSYFMQTVLGSDNPDRIDRALALAERQLPLDQLFSGPIPEVGFGSPAFRMHVGLGTILCRLKDFPGKGWQFLRAGLCSPMPRNRTNAVRALAAWERTDWPPEAEACIRTALETEPDEKLHGMLQHLLAGESVEPEEERQVRQVRRRRFS